MEKFSGTPELLGIIWKNCLNTNTEHSDRGQRFFPICLEKLYGKNRCAHAFGSQVHPFASTKLPDCVIEQRQESLAYKPSVTPRVNTRNNAENHILKYASVDVILNALQFLVNSVEFNNTHDTFNH